MRALILAVALIAATPVLAQPADPRIHVIQYDPDRITPIHGRVGYQIILEFAADERIENVSIGDGLGWQVTPNKRANILFLKPMDEMATTNMTVVTSQRRYLFDLVVPAAGRKAPAAPYAVRFAYPAATPVIAEPATLKPEPAPLVANAAYSITGATQAAPTRVFDDGRMTYFEWPSDAAMPAIFVVAADGSESVVNYAVRDGYVVVQQRAARFSLRNGKQVASVVNLAFEQGGERRDR